MGDRSFMVAAPTLLNRLPLSIRLLKSTGSFNPIQTGLFWPSGLGGVGYIKRPPPLRFLKAIKDIDMKLTPLIKRREINLLLLSYLSCDVT